MNTNETHPRLTPEQRTALADYHVLAAYDLKRSPRYGDMAGARRYRELNRLADALIRTGVHVDRTGHFPSSTPAELAAAFERVGRPRLRRLERETSPVTLTDGTVYTGTRTRYNGTSLDTWRELEAELAPAPTPAPERILGVEDHGIWRGRRTWTVRVDGPTGRAQVSAVDVETAPEATAQALETYRNRRVFTAADRDAMRRANGELGRALGGNR
jgi:hypothetical protein